MADYWTLLPFACLNVNDLSILPVRSEFLMLISYAETTHGQQRVRDAIAGEGVAGSCQILGSDVSALWSDDNQATKVAPYIACDVVARLNKPGWLEHYQQRRVEPATEGVQAVANILKGMDDLCSMLDSMQTVILQKRKEALEMVQRGPSSNDGDAHTEAQEIMRQISKNKITKANCNFLWAAIGLGRFLDGEMEIPSNMGDLKSGFDGVCKLAAKVGEIRTGKGKPGLKTLYLAYHIALMVSPLALLSGRVFYNKAVSRKPMLQLWATISAGKSALILEMEDCVWATILSIAKTGEGITEKVEACIGVLHGLQEKMKDSSDRYFFRDFMHPQIVGPLSNNATAMSATPLGQHGGSGGVFIQPPPMPNVPLLSFGHGTQNDVQMSEEDAPLAGDVPHTEVQVRRAGNGEPLPAPEQAGALMALKQEMAHQRKETPLFLAGGSSPPGRDQLEQMSRNQTPTRGLHGRMVPEDAMDEAEVSRNLAHGEGARSRACSIDKEIGATLDSPRHRQGPARHWSEEQGSADGRGGDDNGGNGLGDDEDDQMGTDGNGGEDDGGNGLGDEDDDQMDTDGNGGDDDGGNELGDHGSLIQGDGHGKRARNAASGELPPVKKVRMGADGISRRIELSHYSEGRPSPFRSLFQFNGLSRGNQTPTGGTSPSGSVGITPARTGGAPTEAQWGDGSEEEEDENLRGSGQSQGDAPDTDKDTPPARGGMHKNTANVPSQRVTRSRYVPGTGHVKKTTKGASALAKESKKKKPRVRPKGSKSGRGEASGAVPKSNVLTSRGRGAPPERGDVHQTSVKRLLHLTSEKRSGPKEPLPANLYDEDGGVWKDIPKFEASHLNASRGSELFVKALAACGKAYRGGRPRHQAGESELIHKMSYHVYVEAVRDAKLMETLKEAGALHKSILLTEVPFEDLKSFSAAMDTLGYIRSEEFIFHDLSYELQADEHPNARHTLASLEQVVQVAASDTGKSLNGLDFSGACLKKNALLDSFEFLKKVWAVTRNARHEVDEFPQSVVEWALASTEGAHHGCHIDGNGFGTVVCPVYGCKLWVLGELPEEKRGVPGYLADLECGEDDEVEWEPILLNPGTALIMAPNTVHAVFSMGPCVFQGWHFYHPRFLSESLVGMAAAILTPNVTNTDHLRLSLEILCRLCTFYRWIYTGERLSESFWGEDLPNANDWECVKDAVSLAVFARSLPHFVPGCDASTLSDVGLQLIDTLTASVRIVVNSGGKRGTVSIKEAVYCPYLFNVVTMACKHHPSQTLQALSDKIPEVESADKGVLTRKGEGLVFPFDSTDFTVLKVH